MGTLVYAQDVKDSAKPQQEEQKPEQTEPSKHAKPSKQEEPSKQVESSRQEEPKPGKTEESKPSKHENARPAHEGSDQKAMQEQRGHAASKGGHIPDDKFRSTFTKAHTFVISRPVIVDNQPRFQYGGYWFEIVNPWPTDWAYTDECYIDYIDGDYFLFDLLHPGERVAIFVTM